MSIGWFEGTMIYETPKEPVNRRQLSQRHSARSSGTESLGKSTLRLKDSHPQVDVMLVVILVFELCKVLNYLGTMLAVEGNMPPARNSEHKAH